MKKSDYTLKSLINAAGVFLYVSAVAWLMFNGKNIFDGSPSFLVPLFMLLLFVISASITSLLVLGNPIHLYLSGQKKEAFILLFSTLGWLVLFAAIVVIFLLIR